MNDWDIDEPLTEGEWREWEKERLKLPPQHRWMPQYGLRRLARELYGSENGKTCFIIGSGPSIKKAESQLMKPIEGSFKIAINAAITKVPADYWFFIDYDAYSRDRNHPNVKLAKTVGSDRFWPMYEDNVYVWERAFCDEDISNGRLLHRTTSLIAAIHFAIWLGAGNIVLVGCDNTIDENKIYDPKDLDIQKFTYARINKSLMVDLPHFKPSWVDLVDASGGSLPLPKVYLNEEIKALTNGSTICATDQTVG